MFLLLKFPGIMIEVVSCICSVESLLHHFIQHLPHLAEIPSSVTTAVSRILKPTSSSEVSQHSLQESGLVFSLVQLAIVPTPSPVASNTTDLRWLLTLLVLKQQRWAKSGLQGKGMLHSDCCTYESTVPLFTAWSSSMLSLKIFHIHRLKSNFWLPGSISRIFLPRIWLRKKQFVSWKEIMRSIMVSENTWWRINTIPSWRSRGTWPTSTF